MGFFWKVELTAKSLYRTLFLEFLDRLLIIYIIGDLFRLIHILNVVFQDKQVRPFRSMEFDAIPIVPFYRTVESLSVLKYYYHRSVVVHLFLVVKAFGIGCFGR